MDSVLKGLTLQKQTGHVFMIGIYTWAFGKYESGTMTPDNDHNRKDL